MKMDNNEWLRSLTPQQLKFVAAQRDLVRVHLKPQEQLIQELALIEDVQDTPKRQAEIYSVKLLDHWGQEFQRTLPDPTHTKYATSDICSDWIRLTAIIDNDTITDLQFTGGGCCMFECSAAITVEHMRGKSREYACNFTYRDLSTLLDVKIPPKRKGCASLAWKCIQELVNETPDDT